LSTTDSQITIAAGMDTTKTKFLSVLLFGIVFGIQSVLAASGMFPKMPAATNVFVVNIHKDSGNAWMTAWALQGMINQNLRRGLSCQ
jgi:hypothetical protein